MSLLRIFENPINGGQIIVSNTTTGAFDVPVETRDIFGVGQVRACIAGRIEIIRDEFGGGVAIVVAIVVA